MQDKKSSGGALPGLPLQSYVVHAIGKNDPDHKVVATTLFKQMANIKHP